MTLMKKPPTKSIVFIFSFLIIIISTASAQENNYSGTEKELQASELFTMANSADYSDNICANIHKDEKNTYYSLDVSSFSTKYEKIRILEFIYGNDAIVSIGMNPDKTKYLFLVNNTLNNSEQNVQDAFKDFMVQSKNELNKLNEEQLRLWLIEHDKYLKE